MAESYASSNCTEHWLTVCQNQFNENNLKTCQEILELRSCLKACANNIWPSHARIRVQYESLMNKVNSFPDCLPPSKGMPFFNCIGAAFDQVFYEIVTVTDPFFFLPCKQVIKARGTHAYMYSNSAIAETK